MAILRKFVARFPWLDELRTGLLTKICTSGIDFYEKNYPVTRIVSGKAQEFIESGEAGIIAVYHGRIIGMLGLFSDRSQITALVSYHRDGELLARFGEALGYKIARGSATYKAVEGALQMVDAARAGQSLVITVDGPRGPIYQVKMGVIRLAEITGLPIIPFVCAVRTGKHLFGWDKMLGGYWGTPMLYLVDDPITVPANCQPERREELRLALENKLNGMREFADQFWDPKLGAFAK
jgi:lysophospholipid acyltransferase (LPLAT)-like uncharacterized protein